MDNMYEAVFKNIDNLSSFVVGFLKTNLSVLISVIELL